MYFENWTKNDRKVEFLLHFIIHRSLSVFQRCIEGCFPTDESINVEKSVRESAIIERSLVSMGNTARLQQVMAKARRGEPVTIAVMGGSITQGGCASAPEKRWANLVAAWWQNSFPGSKINFINAAIGATGSDIGAHRARRDLLCHQPDFVVVEFGVNDSGHEMIVENMEGLSRQILKQSNQPAVMYLFLMFQDGTSEQDRHEAVGRYYGIPMVSYRDGLWPEVNVGRIDYVNDLAADGLHPNDRGHAYCAKFVIHLLEQVRDTLPADEKLATVSAMKPKPLVNDVFEFATIYSANTLEPVLNQGWKQTQFENYPIGIGWSADKPGSVLEFEVQGTAISIVYFRVQKEMGMAQAKVDDGPAVEMNGWFKENFGGYPAYQLVARHLRPGKHKLRITLLPEKDPQSEGNRFEVCAVLAAGQE